MEKMSCDEAINLLSEYYDNELPPYLKSKVKAHLDSCRMCQKKFDNLKRLTGLLKKSHQTSSFAAGEIARETINRLNNTYIVTCDKVLEHLQDYLDGEWERELSFLLKEHIENCPACMQKLTELQALGNLIRTSHATKQLEVEENILLKKQLILKVGEIFKNVDKCEYVQTNLSAYIDKELRKDVMIKVAEHLMYCKYCRRDYETLKDTIGVIDGYFDRTTIPDNNAKYAFIARLTSRTNKKFYISTAVAAVLCVSMLSWFSIHNIEPVIFKSVLKEQPYEHYTPSPPSKDVMYVSAEKYMQDNVYKVPGEKVAAVIYES